MRALEDGPDPHRELVLARAAIPPARPHRFATEPADLIRPVAVWAEDELRPPDSFDISASRIFVVVDRIGKAFGRMRGLSP
jgi:hypothetical protein